MVLTEATKAFLIATAWSCHGHDRRLFMARTVRELGPGGQRRAERELGWNRETIRLGTHELRTGITCLDNFAARGRKRAEVHLPRLLADLGALAASQSQSDPQFKSQRLYIRLSAAEARRQLIAQKGYTAAELPSDSTLSAKCAPSTAVAPTRDPLTRTPPRWRSRAPGPRVSTPSRPLVPAFFAGT
jgi:hypothetical protein